jgi:hypothetical protein
LPAMPFGRALYHLLVLGAHDLYCQIGPLLRPTIMIRATHWVNAGRRVESSYLRASRVPSLLQGYRRHSAEAGQRQSALSMRAV